MITHIRQFSNMFEMSNFNKKNINILSTKRKS